ncbi:MAG: hydrogen gas-evolving membrane-bound hydrogenase subunit E, partial [Pseudomonadota bacterium]
PPFGMWAAPALLVVMVVIIGIAPFLAEGIVTVAASAVTGADLHPHLKIWHGVTPALWMSVIAIAGGAVLLSMHGGLDRLWIAAPRPEAKAIFDRLIAFLVATSRTIAEISHNGAISRYLAIFTVTSVGLGWMAYSTSGVSAPTRDLLPVAPVIAVGWLMLLVATISIVTMHHRRFRALILIGIIGLTISAGFAYLSAPDLALTQISVETVTIMLLLLALHFMPKETPKESSAGLRLRDAVIALGAGGGVAALAYAFMLRDIETISDYHIANSYEGGGGTNVVNVILVDFRGYDTFGEIIVLGIAGLVIFALMHALLDGPAARRLKNVDYSQDRSRDRHPLMMVVVTRILMPIAIVVGLYIFLRGHNEPGGGFVAGLVVAIALLMQYMASGFAWTQDRKRIEYHTMIGLGVVIAGLTGVGAWLAGAPFLTSAYTYVHLPPIEEFELATAMLFDLGVFLTVLGGVMLMLYSLSRIARFAGETVNVEPMSFDPGEHAEEEAVR